jgi:hypothetical protein
MRPAFPIPLLLELGRMVFTADVLDIHSVGGNFNPMSSIVSAMICDTARLRNHLWFDGITYQGALFVLVAAIASS